MCYLTRAREAAKSGYALSESIHAPGLYHVHKPNSNAFYFVDLDGPAPTCNCQSRVICKHIGLVEISRRFWLALDRKAAAQSQPARRRPLFSRKHLAALRNCAPVMAGPAPKTAHVWTAEALARKARVEASLLVNFPV